MLNANDVAKQIALNIKPLAKEHGYSIRINKLSNGSASINLRYSDENVSNKLLCGIYRIDNVLKVIFRLFIAYPPVEQIIHPILFKNNIFGSSPNYKDVYVTFYAPEDFESMPPSSENPCLIIQQTADIEQTAEDLVTFFTTDALPHFRRWQHLPDVCRHIMQDDSREFIGKALGIEATFKKATIMKICDHPDSEHYLNQFIEARKNYLEKLPKNEDVINYYRAAFELKEILNQTTPLYQM